ncbi:signal transduction histidine kinase [Haloactinospora alba]|uniref:Signal transduction histidine kinase n=2 Tax=Haloactinospora alba TaxID=405555 RepID=A0A543NMR5_9ACTN|nr:signal transduction histidine kinase [Haloactinospora alba]
MENRQGRVSEPSDTHAWEVSWWWHALVLAGLAVVAGTAYATAPPGWRWVALALMGALVVWFPLGGWLLLSAGSRYGSPRDAVFVLVVAVLYTPVCVITPPASWGMFVVAPVCFMLAGRWFGLATVATVLLVPQILQLPLGRATPGELAFILVVYVPVLGFSAWMSFWIERIIDQSAERSELITELRRSRAEVTRLSEEAGAMAEREHLAREIHDTLAQGFTSIVTLANAVEAEISADPQAARRHVAMMRDTASENLAEARALVAARGPAALDATSLEEALSRATRRLGEELGADARFTTTGEGFPPPSAVQVGLLRAAQEALANVRKHAAAGRVTVTLAYEPGRVALEVTDDGRGFDSGTHPPGHGLESLTARAERAGGACEVHSRPGAGTEVRMTVPVTNEPGGRQQ